MQIRRLTPLAAAGVLALSVLGGWSPAQADTDEGYVAGTVTDAAGKPLVGVDARLFWCNTTDDGDPADADGCYSTSTYDYGSTDRNGRYVLSTSNYSLAYASRPGQSGSWKVSLQRIGYTTPATALAVSPAPRAVVAAPAASLAPTTPGAAPANAALTGVLTDAAGAPVVGGFVEAYDASGREVGTAITDATGRYYFVVGDPAGVPPAEYASENVTGSVRLFAYGPGLVSEWSGGTLAKSKATAVPVAAYGATAPNTAPTMALGPVGTITGSVRLPAAGANWTAGISVYDLDGSYVTGADTDSAGAFSVDLAPGEYYVRADGSRYTEGSANDPACPGCTEVLDTFGFVAGYYGGGTSLLGAKTLTVKPGASASARTITLTNALKAVEKPEVKGKLKNGALAPNKKLKVTTGVWNRRTDVDYSYVWKVGSKKLGTKSSLKVTKKIQKKIGSKLGKLTVTVTATDEYGELVDGKATVKVKKALTQKDKKDKKDKK